MPMMMSSLKNSSISFMDRTRHYSMNWLLASYTPVLHEVKMRLYGWRNYLCFSDGNSRHPQDKDTSHIGGDILIVRLPLFLWTHFSRIPMSKIYWWSIMIVITRRLTLYIWIVIWIVYVQLFVHESLSTTSNDAIFLQYFLAILKHSLRNS